ncbi:MAG TPA: BatD family protein [Bacteroidales bacterium]|nr:BatD family protein [Bacteroidales bacterium]
MRWILTIKKALFTFLLFTFTAGYAQNVQVRASAPSNVAVGQQFNLTYSCSEKATINLPYLADFDILGGPQTSSSSSIQIINGQMTSTSNYSYTYVLRAKKEGTFEIPSAVAVVDGKNVHSNKLQIRVSADNTQSSGQANKQNPSSQSQGINEKDFFIKAFVSNTNPYVEEEVIVRYKLYLPAQVQRYQASIRKNPTSSGFWTYELTDRNVEPPQTTETINGTQYTVIDIYSLAVFPQKSGKLTITPLEIQTVVQIVVQAQRSNDPWDAFFNNPFFGGGRLQNRELTILSNAITLTAKELPKNAPANNSGLVGNFKVSTKLSRSELTTNDATNFTVSISGKGNIQHIEAPEIQFSSDFDVQEPIINDDIHKSPQGISGTRTFEYIIVPRNPGNFTIPAISFSYFDKTKNQYITLKTAENHLKIKKGTTQSSQYSSVDNKKNVQIIGKDIRFIKTNLSLQKQAPVFILSPYYWTVFALPLILFIVFLLILKKQIKKRSDSVAIKDKKASKTARKRLQAAEKLLTTNNEEEFYIEISKALWGYMSDKFNIPLAQLSLDTAKEKLEERKLSATYINDFLEVLNLCEYVRFAPNNDLTPQKMYEKTFDFITTIERELKKGK